MDLSKKAIGWGSVKGLEVGDKCIIAGLALAMIGYGITRKSSTWAYVNEFIDRPKAYDNENQC